MTNPFLVQFVADPANPWQIDRIEPVVGDSLMLAPRLVVQEGGGRSAPVRCRVGLARDIEQHLLHHPSGGRGAG